MVALLISLSTNVIAAFLAIWVHEIPKYYLTLYLTKPMYRKEVKIKGIWHQCIDPIGLILFLFMNVGWQMPLRLDSVKLINKKNGVLAISVFGILINLLAAIATVLFQKTVLHSIGIDGMNLDYINNLLIRFSYYSVVLFVVNLLPVPPMDMTKLIYALSPNAYFKILQNTRVLQAGFVLFVAFGGLQTVSLIVFQALFRFLL